MAIISKVTHDNIEGNTELYDVEMDANVHVSHFGALKAASTIPVISANFPGSSLNTTLWNQGTLNGGNITVENGVGKLFTSTNTAGSIKLLSVRKGVFEAGQVTVYQSGVYAGVGVADNVRRWGLMDATEQNGLFFEWNGTDFRVVARAGGTDTAVTSPNFSGDKSFLPKASNNTYRIHYSAGRALFQRASGGKIVTLHSMVDGNLPLVEDLDLGLYYENTNSGNNTDVEMRVRGASSSVFGDLRRFNTGGALLTQDFGNEVSLGIVPGYSIDTKFGRNPDVDTTSTPEDLWGGSSTYTGFNATANQNIAVVSADANDTGTVVSSGTATGGSATTIVDSSATFSSDGVAAGDCVVNDTQAAHGIVASVDSETQLTVYRMTGARIQGIFNVSGDTYRVVNANSTGAALIRLEGILDEDYVEQTPKYAVLNGASTVTVTVNAIRCSRAKIIIAGSSGVNEGVITINQATTTANVFANVPATGRTTIAATTVPAGKLMVLKRVRAAITRANGSAGSATILLNAR